jgi:nucleoside-diphosphate-sugar epimerase
VTAPTALVTGGTGGVGRALVAALARDGLRVRAVVRPESIRSRRAADLDARQGVNVVEVALDDEPALHRVLADCEVVVHLAAQTRPAPRWVHARVTVGGTATLVRAARRAGVGRFVHVSSAAVYGRLPAQGAVREHAPLRGRGTYAEAKIAAEAIVDRAIRSGLPAVVLRPTLVHGDKVEVGLLDVADQFARAEPWLPSHAGRMQPVHVDDVVRSIRAALACPDVSGAVNVAGPDTVAPEELARVVDRVRAKRPIGPLELLPPRYSTERLLFELGVRARIGLAAGLDADRHASARLAT